MFENFVEILLYFFDFLQNLFLDVIYGSDNVDLLLPQNFSKIFRHEKLSVVAF